MYTTQHKVVKPSPSMTVKPSKPPKSNGVRRVQKYPAKQEKIRWALESATREKTGSRADKRNAELREHDATARRDGPLRNAGQTAHEETGKQYGREGNASRTTKQKTRLTARKDWAAGAQRGVKSERTERERRASWAQRNGKAGANRRERSRQRSRR